MVYNVLRRERPEPEGRASHRSVTDGGRGLLTANHKFLSQVILQAQSILSENLIFPQVSL
ncbi:MAG: hypothetical protein ACOCQG_05345 [Candidatus Nanoarchaeia archaeon]